MRVLLQAGGGKKAGQQDGRQAGAGCPAVTIAPKENQDSLVGLRQRVVVTTKTHRRGVGRTFRGELGWLMLFACGAHPHASVLQQ